MMLVLMIRICIQSQFVFFIIQKCSEPQMRLNTHALLKSIKCLFSPKIDIFRTIIHDHLLSSVLCVMLCSG